MLDAELRPGSRAVAIQDSARSKRSKASRRNVRDGAASRRGAASSRKGSSKKSIGAINRASEKKEEKKVELTEVEKRHISNIMKI